MAETRKPKTRAEPLHVNASLDADRPVVITPEDEDRFVKSCGWVVEASRLGISVDVWRRELHSMLSRVQQFCEEHRKLVRFCFATKRDEQIGIYFVPAAGRYDTELGPLLTELDVELAQKHQKCYCDVFQMPARSAAQRIEQLGQDAIIIYGDITGTPGKVVA